MTTGSVAVGVEIRPSHRHMQAARPASVYTVHIGPFFPGTFIVLLVRKFALRFVSAVTRESSATSRRTDHSYPRPQAGAHISWLDYKWVRFRTPRVRWRPKGDGRRARSNITRVRR